jgi:hypothetical protein
MPAGKTFIVSIMGSAPKTGHPNHAMAHNAMAHTATRGEMKWVMKNSERMIEAC